MAARAGAEPAEADSALDGSRTQFLASLARRLDAVRQALAAVEAQPASSAHRDHLRRRIHALGAAAGVLGFDGLF
ncbi:MAG: hypothetical protein FJ104_03140, partial [Deltaproteobacteria bacterium]|nr:hypothetical protein [Deltaproteobacteria bacterium]